jgi:NADPH-dependent 2,4-dienoyl-CoA reductase/sulfur reductase-like enzyme
METTMPQYKYLLVGGGMAASAAARGIRKLDKDGTIGLIGSESDRPYKRPSLSKGLWKDQTIDDIWSGTEKLGVTFHLGRNAERLDPGRKVVVDDQGTPFGFDKLLLATGASPRRLPFGGDDIIYFRSLADYRRLRALSERGNRFAVIGGGFIGWEIAAALAMNGKEVTMLFPEPYIGHRVYPADLGEFLNRFYREKGVEVLAGRKLLGLDRQGEWLALKTRDGDGQEETVEVDAAVAGIGVTPNTELAQAAGLEVADGVIVDEFLRTSHPDVYAAGDVASFYNPALERRLRVEHEDNANTMGRYAGRVMAGAHERYRHLPFFYSDLFDLGYEAVGELDPRLEVVAEWAEPFREGVVAYVSNGRIRGLLLWNVWEQVKAARQIVVEGAVFDSPARLRERLRALVTTAQAA